MTAAESKKIMKDFVDQALQRGLVVNIESVLVVKECLDQYDNVQLFYERLQESEDQNRVLKKQIEDLQQKKSTDV